MLTTYVYFASIKASEKQKPQNGGKTMRDRIEKALPGKKYQYVGYSRTSRVNYIFKPKTKGHDWYARHKDMLLCGFFCRTLSEVNDKLGSI